MAEPEPSIAHGMQMMLKIMKDNKKAAEKRQKLQDCWQEREKYRLTTKRLLIRSLLYLTKMTLKYSLRLGQLAPHCWKAVLTSRLMLGKKELIADLQASLLLPFLMRRPDFCCFPF